MPMDRQSSRLSSAQLKLFFAILIRNRVVFDHFKVNLTVNHFVEETYRLVYQVVLAYVEEHNTLPQESQLTVEVQTALYNRQEDPSDELLDALSDLVDYVFGPTTFRNQDPEHTDFTTYAFKIGQQILLLKHKQSLQEELLDQDVNLLSDFLDAALQSHSLLSLTGYSTEQTLTFEPEWDVQDIMHRRSTGVGYLDRFLNGGTVDGEVYLFMAPYGTCKTTQGVMLWCLAAKQAYHDYLINPDSPKGLSVLVSYEAPLSQEIRNRALMYTAMVHRDRLELMGTAGLNSLSDDPDNPLPYEHQLFRQQIQDQTFIPERQRVEQAISWLNKHTLCLDFSGSDPRFPKAGYGGIAEITQRIELEIRNRGNVKVNFVCVDYLGVMCNRHNDTIAGRKEEVHTVYRDAIAKISSQIAKRFKTPAWVLHQLSGEANAVTSLKKKLHHTDAEGSKKVAENADFAFVVSNLNPDSMGKLACTKHRRAQARPDVIIKVDGAYNYITAPDNYCLDNRGQIVDKSTMATVGAANLDLPDIEDI